jgi:hypothetical protein
MKTIINILIIINIILAIITMIMMTYDIIKYLVEKVDE